MNTKIQLAYYTDNKYFAFTNPNPRAIDYKAIRWDTADCCVRALAIAADCTWIEAYDFLTAKARKEFSVLNDGIGFRRWLVAAGAEWHHLPAIKGKKRMTGKEFAETHPEGRYIIYVANHECACVDGKLRDVWNCGGKALVGYFDMSNFKF